MPGCCVLNTCTFADAPLVQLAAHLHFLKQSLLAPHGLPAACCCTAAEALLCCATSDASCCTLVHKLAMSAAQVAGPGTEWCSRCCKALRALVCMPAGNVARFINHSCKGNLVIQPVFTHGCNGLLYRIALFASEEIAANTELTYDYGYAEGVVHNRLMVCKCGSEHCRKRLL